MKVIEVETLVARAREFARRQRRTILGIVGPPGGGKSTLAQTVVTAVGSAAVLVPMDGFHLAQAELVRLGRRHRMGAPDTFDALGYIALLRRLRDRTEEVVYAPGFRREIEEPIAGAIAVPRATPLVVTEGNYLLVPDEPWAGVRPLLDECWYADLDEATRLRWLIQRHVEHGKTPQAAREWVHRSDEANAAVVAATRSRADVVVRLPVPSGEGHPAAP
ncbi:MAG TPA: nucleoside/nucleotide kinase family protein [Acidimicrobiales bacterium]|nr:nucleoside/nucleotide kinase family protein [Acidimicrobiales bacterium]